ncbi:MAG: nucleoside triphosphate pyrophosphatase [Candidatus Krumholzibacteriota bacterium]
MTEPRHLTPFVNWPHDLVLVLASRSPRRAELLTIAGIPHEIVPPGPVEEELAASLTHLHHDPAAYAVDLAVAKARDVARSLPGRLVLGSDTVVVLDGDVLEKPADHREAVHLVSRLAGRKHVVISAVALVGGPAGEGPVVAHEETEVEFLSLAPEAIERYVATGEPMDKAGAYGIQGYGAMMVRGVRGCYFNVMGLPLARLGELLNGVLA